MRSLRAAVATGLGLALALVGFGILLTQRYVAEIEDEERHDATDARRSATTSR